SSTLISDASGNVVWRATYKPYGADRTLGVTTFTPKDKFTGKEQELDGTGFYDYGARLYNPATGRWLSADSSIADGLNRYAYVRNNPLYYRDPTGHEAGVWETVDNDLSYFMGSMVSCIIGHCGPAAGIAKSAAKEILAPESDYEKSQRMT